LSDLEIVLRSSTERLIETSNEYFTWGEKCLIHRTGWRSVQNVGQKKKQNTYLNISLLSNSAQNSMWNGAFQQFCLRWKFIRGMRYTMKGIHSVLTGTQLLLVIDMQHGVVRALNSMFERWVFVTRRSPNKGNNWLRSCVINQT